MTVGNQTAERIYYDEPALLLFTATVTAIREVARVDGKQVWQIALDRTAFYPTSGGQPYDTGVLTATARSGATLDVPITSVEEDDAGEVWHTTAKPLQEGTEVAGVVDGARRRDHMQQHTGQHLLSAALDRDLGLSTVSFHLGDATSTIDLEGAAPTEEQLVAAEAEVNRVIASALPLGIRSVSAEEAESMLKAGLLRKLPPRAGAIRLIEIPGVDLNACGGTHVATTAEIGSLLLRGTERVRNTTRLTFVCGSRALAAAHRDFRTLTGLAQSLSTSPGDIAAAIGRLQTENKAGGKEIASLLASLAVAEAKEIAAGEKTVIHRLEPGRGLAYAKLLASELVQRTPVRVALMVAPEPERASVVLAAKPATVDCGTLLRESLAEVGARGGGSKEMAQGALATDAVAGWLEAIRPRLMG